jgi:hypothetical protein
MQGLVEGGPWTAGVPAPQPKIDPVATPPVNTFVTLQVLPTMGEHDVPGIVYVSKL